MKYPVLFFTVICFLFTSCNSNINKETYGEIQKKGNEISSLTQSTLLMNVGKAIQEGGPQNAVEFCNLNASSIVDKINADNNCTISRVSNKNRNPENNLKLNVEQELWKVFQNGTTKDTVIKSGDNLVFYKPIKIALPACLKCHGSKESDINNETQKKLRDLYPNDLATGYKLNDLRGLWKIEFNY